MNKVVTKTDMPTISRRKFLKIGGAAVIASIASVPLYSFFFERFWLDINKIQLAFPQLPAAFSGTKIVHFSDLHLGEFFDVDHLQKIVNHINSLKPDLICFTGDLVEDRTDILERSTTVLQQMHAPLGKIAIFGNHDYRIGKQQDVANALIQSGFVFLQNNHTSINILGEKIFVAGTDDMFGGGSDIPKAIQGIPDNQFTILLAHEPDLADIAAQHPIHLQLSGHSHGGQIRVPFVGALFTPDGAKKYIEGLIPVKNSNIKLYVNRGIGTTALPFRFHCRPELTVITLTK
ncbi:MAG: metallophosphoesterase [Heyndrickxia sp.]